MVLHMPETIPEKIWRYIYEKGEVRSRDLKKQFEDTGLLSHGTINKYRGILEAEGKIKAKPVKNTRPPHNVYYVPKRFHEKLEAMIQRQKINSMLDSLSSEEQIITVNIWSEIQMVVESMLKMGYPLEEIRSILVEQLEELHSKLVDRIVKDAEEEA